MFLLVSLIISASILFLFRRIKCYDSFELIALIFHVTIYRADCPEFIVFPENILQYLEIYSDISMHSVNDEIQNAPR